MDALHVRLEQIGGCGDGGCMIHVRPGMHTNGGCRCSTDPLKMRQTVHTYKMTVKEQAQEIERLRAALKDAYDCFTTYNEHMPEYMHGESLKTHIKRYIAALMPKEEK